MLPSIDWVTAIQTGGFATLAVVGLWALATGFLRSGKQADQVMIDLKAEFDKRDTVRDRREAELIKERDEWKQRSFADNQRLDQLADRLQLAYDILTGSVQTPGKGPPIAS